MRGKVKPLSLVAKAVLVLVCLVMIIPSIIYLCPFLIGADGSYIVLGGSMKPTLSPGDLAFTEKVDPAEVEVDEIVVVRSDSGVYMHRVVEANQSLFRLKGDANEEPDSSYVNGSEIIGKTSLILPMGYTYTKIGYILTMSAPLMVLAFYQSFKLYKFYTRKKRRSLRVCGKRRKFSLLDTTSILLLLILVAGSTHMMAPYFAIGSVSFFTDVESSSGNVVRAGIWRVSSSITCSVSNLTISLGENVTVHGSINPARSGVAVTLTYGWNDTTTTRTVKTNALGAYEDIFALNQVGSWTIRASWDGDGSYFGASSGVITVSVTLVTEP